MNPVLVDQDNRLIVGHGRLEAAKKLGMAVVPAIEEAKALAKGFSALPATEQIHWLGELVARVVLGRKRLAIEFSPDGLKRAFLAPSQSNRDTSSVPYTVTVEVTLKRCRHEMRLLPTDGPPAAPCSNARKTLQEAVAKAFSWKEALVAGRVSSLSELARKEGVTQRYIARMFKLAFLSPEVVEAIIDGQIPPTLTLERLKKGFSLDWQAQRRELLAHNVG